MPEGGDGSIRFSVGAALTVQEAPATKFGAMKEGTDFVSGDVVWVYGRRNAGDPVFDGNPVTLTASGWSYGDLKYWNWGSSTDYYDFLAVYKPAGITPTTTCSSTANPYRLSVSYDAAATQYDLMLAGRRRTYSGEANRLAPVPLVFDHMLSAVTVKLNCPSRDTDVTLDAYHFKNIVTRGAASVSAEYDGEGKPAYAWSGTIRQGALVGGTDSDLTVHKDDEERTRAVGSYDLMIPQSHTEANGASGYPALVVDYTLGGFSTNQVTILLKDIPVAGSTTPITRWEAGEKYCYEIKIDPAGIVFANITITPWASEKVAGENVIF